MDKYVLVPQDRYDNILRNEKANVTSNTSNNNRNKNEIEDIKAPPPGIPADDEFAVSGIEVSEQEAQQIAESLVGVALNKSNTQKVIKEGSGITSKQGEGEGWKSFWQAVNK